MAKQTCRRRESPSAASLLPFPPPGSTEPSLTSDSPYSREHRTCEVRCPAVCSTLRVGAPPSCERSRLGEIATRAHDNSYGYMPAIPALQELTPVLTGTLASAAPITPSS